MYTRCTEPTHGRTVAHLVATWTLVIDSANLGVTRDIHGMVNYNKFSRSTEMLDQGVCAEVRVGAEHLRLFSEANAQGLQASVYNAVTKTWVAPSEAVAKIGRAHV